MFGKNLRAQFEQWPDAALNGLLIAIGLFLIALAFVPKHRIEKIIVLAWVLMP